MNIVDNEKNFLSSFFLCLLFLLDDEKKVKAIIMMLTYLPAGSSLKHRLVPSLVGQTYFDKLKHACFQLCCISFQT